MVKVKMVKGKLKMVKTDLRFSGMPMTSSTGIFEMITSYQGLWPSFITLVLNKDLSIRLNLCDYRSLNINEKIILED